VLRIGWKVLIVAIMAPLEPVCGVGFRSGAFYPRVIGRRFSSGGEAKLREARDFAELKLRTVQPHCVSMIWILRHSLKAP